MRISDWSSDVCSSDLAEAVAYSLQALGRATIVGETTGGGAHPFEYRRVHEHFAVDLPEGKSINPVTGTNWQGTGVKPDVEVPAGQALDTAIDLARKALKTRPATASGPPAPPSPALGTCTPPP